MKCFYKIRIVSALLLMCLMANPLAYGGAKTKSLQLTEKPDFTKVGTTISDEMWDNALGSTGAFGWIYNKAGDFNGVTQIYITKVTPGTPAHGKLQKGDVVLGASAGVKAKAFENDARREFAMALIDAEGEANKGLLALKVWRAGETKDVQLTLPVIKGAYDPDKPATCERAQAIINILANAIGENRMTGEDIEEKEAGNWQGVFDNLGLLATGDKKYLPLVKKFANSFDIKEPLDLNSRAKTGWAWGYITLFLAEYYGATGDESVLPALKEYATKLAMGQAYAGTWNHCVANPDMHENFGQLHGRLGGYGAINQTTLSCAIALVIAKKVGVDNKEISDAIQRSKEHFLFFVDKGAIPYGDNPPAMGYSSNGKNASAAVFFDLLGEKKGASFFSRMVTASYASMDTGHTGHFFSQLWTGMAVACSGDDALNAFTKEREIYHELERRPGGVSLYQPEMNGNRGKYIGWSLNGARLLHYCAPRRVLYITGKARTTPALIGDELAETIAYGREDQLFGDLQQGEESAEGGSEDGEPDGGASRDERVGKVSTKELLGMLGSWSPRVREGAARTLGERDDNVVPKLIAMLDSENPYERYGACTGLRWAGRSSDEAVDALIAKGLHSKDLNTRYFAVEAFSAPRTWVREGEKKGWVYPKNGLGKAGLRAANELLKLAATPDPVNDPRQKVQMAITGVLFYDGSAGAGQGLLSEKVAGPKALDKVDRKQLVDATKVVLKNQHGGARSGLARAVYPELTKEEREELRKDIVQAVRVGAPSNIMFSWGVRYDGLAVLAKDKDPEVPALVGYLLTNWERGAWPEKYLDPLKGYDSTAAKPALPGLKAFLAKLQEDHARLKTKGEKYEAAAEEKAKQAKTIEELIKKIENSQ